jgi:hypothetical protein
MVGIAIARETYTCVFKASYSPTATSANPSNSLIKHATSRRYPSPCSQWILIASHEFERTKPLLQNAGDKNRKRLRGAGKADQSGDLPKLFPANRVAVPGAETRWFVVCAPIKLANNDTLMHSTDRPPGALQAARHCPGVVGSGAAAGGTECTRSCRKH